MCMQGGEQAVLDHRPHPVDLLSPAALLQLSRLPQCLQALLDRGPHALDARVLQRAARRHLGLRTRAHQVQRRAILGPCPLRADHVVSIGLVDRDHVRDLEDAALDALELVPRSGQHEHQVEIHHVGHHGLRLADTHGLHQHHVEAGGLAEQERLTRLPGHASQGSAGRTGPDVRGALARQPRHARLVAQDAPTRDRARRVDRQHRHALAEPDQVHAERVDERALPHARHAADAHPQRPSRVGEQPGEHLLRERLVLGVLALDERDGAGEHGALLGPHALDVGVDRQGLQASPSMASSLSSSSPAALEMTVPGPKIAAAPASRRAS